MFFDVDLRVARRRLLKRICLVLSDVDDAVGSHPPHETVMKSTCLINGIHF